MKILFDYQGLVQKHSGGSKMYFELMKHFPPEVECQVGLVECDNVHLQRLKVIDVPSIPDDYSRFLYGLKIPHKHFLYKLYSDFFPHCTSLGRNKSYSIKLMKEQNYDIFHPTFLDDYFLPYIGDKPFVFHIHDMTTTILRQYFSSNNDYQTLKKRKLASLAAHIVAVSENTKKDVMELLNIPEEKITVIYHGADDWNYKLLENKYNFNYLLYVGGRSSYKFYIEMLMAIKGFLLRHKDIKLLTVGAPFNSREIALINKLNLKDNIIRISASDEELMSLYSNAMAFIYPSIYEGFGIPILEAYRAKCPVILNNTSCFPEIADGAAIYFEMNSNHSNLDEVLEGFIKLPQKVKEELIDRQLERLKLFSWNQAALQLSEVYKNILQK